MAKQSAPYKIKGTYKVVYQLYAREVDKQNGTYVSKGNIITVYTDPTIKMNTKNFFYWMQNNIKKRFIFSDGFINGGWVIPVGGKYSTFSGAEGDTPPTPAVISTTSKPVPALVNNLPSILGSAGMLGGLYYAFNSKSGFWGFVGYGLLGSIAGHLAGNIVKGTLYPSSAKVVSQEKTTTTTVIQK